jgi:hypothetical protein
VTAEISGQPVVDLSGGGGRAMVSAGLPKPHPQRQSFGTQYEKLILTLQTEKQVWLSSKSAAPFAKSFLLVD